MLRSAMQALALRHQGQQFQRLFSAGGALLYPDVVVPPLGESVSEGTISAMLKKAGERVNVDDVVAQLETDKVTIDCRTPHAGVLSQVLAKVGDVVKPGSILCIVGEGAGAAAPSGAPVASPAAPAAASAPAAAAAASGSGHRQPMIHFPPRVLPDGRRISDLPEAEAAAATASASKAAAAPAAAAAATPPSAAAAPPPPPPPKPQSASSPVVKTTILTSLPPRRTLTQKEIDMINAGGAF